MGSTVEEETSPVPGDISQDAPPNGHRAGTGLLCSPHDLDRFWSKIQKTPDCWLWIAGHDILCAFFCTHFLGTFPFSRLCIHEPCSLHTWQRQDRRSGPSNRDGGCTHTFDAADRLLLSASGNKPLPGYGCVHPGKESFK